MEDFNDCVSTCSLIDLPFDGPLYTWTSGRGLGIVRRRLDRMLCPESYNHFFPNLRVRHLPRLTSDHAPLLLRSLPSDFRGPKSFCFQNMWVEHAEFYSFVKTSWDSYPTVGGMRGLYNKLHQLKKDLQDWNKSVFGNIFDQVHHLEQELQRCEACFDANPSPETRMKYHVAQAQYKITKRKRLLFWAQKARQNCLAEGDANTSYFHNIVKDRHYRQTITNIRDSDGNICDTQTSIQQAAVNYYTSLFTADPISDDNDIVDHIPTVISDTENQFMVALPTNTEVKEAVWTLDPNSAPGPDGYNGYFFRKCWDIAKIDVHKVI